MINGKILGSAEEKRFIFFTRKVQRILGRILAALMNDKGVDWGEGSTLTRKWKADLSIEPGQRMENLSFNAILFLRTGKKGEKYSWTKETSFRSGLWK